MFIVEIKLPNCPTLDVGARVVIGSLHVVKYQNSLTQFYQLWRLTDCWFCLCVCLFSPGGERAHQGGEGSSQVPPIQLPHQVHQHDGAQSWLFYRLVPSCRIWGNKAKHIIAVCESEDNCKTLPSFCFWTHAPLTVFTEHVFPSVNKTIGMV